MHLNPYFYGCLLLGSVFLQGCGFQLRHNISLPTSLQPVLIQAPAALAPIAALLQQRLSEQDVAVAQTADKAKLWIELSDETHGERVVSVAAVSTTLKEVELTHQLTLQVRKPDGTVLVEKKPLRQVREFIYDEQAVLAKANEEQLLREDMQAEIIAHILRRLTHIPNDSH